MRGLDQAQLVQLVLRHERLRHGTGGPSQRALGAPGDGVSLEAGAQLFEFGGWRVDRRDLKIGRNPALLRLIEHSSFLLVAVGGRGVDVGEAILLVQPEAHRRVFVRAEAAETRHHVRLKLALHGGRDRRALGRLPSAQQTARSGVAAIRGRQRGRPLLTGLVDAVLGAGARGDVFVRAVEVGSITVVRGVDGTSTVVDLRQRETQRVAVGRLVDGGNTVNEQGDFRLHDATNAGRAGLGLRAHVVEGRPEVQRLQGLDLVGQIAGLTLGQHLEQRAVPSRRVSD